MSAVNEQRPQNIHQEKLEAILASAVDAIVTINDAGLIESVNPATETMFGFSPDEVIGQNVTILMPSPFREEHDRYISDYLKTGQRKIIGIGREVAGRKKDGTVFPIHLAVSELILNGRRIFTGMVRDISDVKNVEAKLVQNERLAAIGQMMAGLAHESRNAFQRSHACLTNLAFDVREMPESLDLVHKVQHALDHLNALLDEVRDYAAPIVLEKSATRLELLVRDTWEQLVTANPESAAIDFGIEVDSRFPEELKIDRVRFGQVIWNVLENARSACDGRQGMVRVRLYINDQLLPCVEIHDNGSGIRADSRDHIFDPFFTTKTRGTGLGLAICKRIISAHDGQVLLGESLLGGASFLIRLSSIPA